MICYRDRRYCDYWQTCVHGKTCDRALTDDVIRHAEAWWRSFHNSPGHAPIDVYAEEPDCYEPIGEPNEDNP